MQIKNDRIYVLEQIIILIIEANKTNKIITMHKSAVH